MSHLQLSIIRGHECQAVTRQLPVDFPPAAGVGWQRGHVSRQCGLLGQKVGAGPRCQSEGERGRPPHLPRPLSPRSRRTWGRHGDLPLQANGRTPLRTLLRPAFSPSGPLPRQQPPGAAPVPFILPQVRKPAGGESSLLHAARGTRHVPSPLSQPRAAVPHALRPATIRAHHSCQAQHRNVSGCWCRRYGVRRHFEGGRGPRAPAR